MRVVNGNQPTRREIVAVIHTAAELSVSAARNMNTAMEVSSPLAILQRAESQLCEAATELRELIESMKGDGTEAAAKAG